MSGVLYTFFSFTAEGATVHFEALQFRSESDAISYAGRVFEEEPSAAEVLVYDSEREVSREFRPPLLRSISSAGERMTRELKAAA